MLNSGINLKIFILTITLISSLYAMDSETFNIFVSKFESCIENGGFSKEQCQHLQRSIEKSTILRKRKNYDRSEPNQTEQTDGGSCKHHKGMKANVNDSKKTITAHGIGKNIAKDFKKDESKTPPSKLPKDAQRIFKNKNTGFCFYVSPTKNKSCVYTFNATEEHSLHRIEPKNRIDFSKLLPNKKPLLENELFDALLKLEIRLRALIKEKKDFAATTIYVGETSHTLKQRANGHISELRGIEKAPSWSGNAKVQIVDHSLKIRHVRASALVNNIKDLTHRYMIEILVSNLTGAQVLGGSSRVGNTKAKNMLIKYYRYKKRTSKLKKLGLVDVCENTLNQMLANKFTTYDNKEKNHD
jgi:hypothetical protein